MVTLDEFRAEIRREVQRREHALRVELNKAIVVMRQGNSHFWSGRTPREIQDEIALLTGVPARLSIWQRVALRLAASRDGVVRAKSRPCSFTVPPATICSLEARGLMVAHRGPRGGVRAGELTPAGWEAQRAIEARQGRFAEEVFPRKKETQ